MIRAIADDVLACLSFYTRLPVPGRTELPGFAQACWASPLAGALVGSLGGLAYAGAHAAGLAPALAALIALGATIALTGALHEDGLADTADGFGGGRTRERALDIMRDSRIGTFGACALLLSVLLRAGALAGLAGPGPAAAALIAAHLSARAALPLFMRMVPPARGDGLSAGAGRPPLARALAAASLGLAGLLLCLPADTALIALTFIAAAALAMARLCRRRVGGQTGDVRGALEQVLETLVLLVAAARLSP